MQATWILVADRSRARLFAASPDGTSLTELQDLVNPDGRHPEAPYAHDRPPRVIESMGGTRHAIEPHTSPEDKVATRFVHDLNEVLEQGRVEHRYERLVLAAPPGFLGALRGHLGKQVRACIVADVDKDLVTLPAPDIAERLQPQLRA